MVPSKGILRGIAEGFLEFRSWGPDMGIFQKFWPTPRNPWVPHIWAPRTNFQKPFGYPTQNPLRGYHAKFQAIRHSSFFWRDPGYEKWHSIFYYEYACTLYIGNGKKINKDKIMDWILFLEGTKYHRWHRKSNTQFIYSTSRAHTKHPNWMKNVQVLYSLISTEGSPVTCRSSNDL